MPLPLVGLAVGTAIRVGAGLAARHGAKKLAKKGVQKAIGRTPRLKETSHAKRLRRGGFDKPGWAQTSKNFK